MKPCPNCWRFAKHFTVFACRRAARRAGRSIEITRATMPMTTSSSTSVKARREQNEGRRMDMANTPVAAGPAKAYLDALRSDGDPVIRPLMVPTVGALNQNSTFHVHRGIYPERAVVAKRHR